MEEHIYNNDRHRKQMFKEIEDRLSLLPDAILTDILSLLPFDKAVTTSVLSRRWRNLWTGVTFFKLDNSIHQPTPSIYHVMSKLCSLTIRNFTLLLDHTLELCLNNSSSVSRCFHIVCGRKVEVINVKLNKMFVPACVFQCPTLVSLELSGKMDCEILEHTTVCLPNLKRLHMYHTELPSFQSMDTLLKSCPLLEDLCLEIHLLYGKNLIEIFVPNLKRLRIVLLFTAHVFQVKIDTPKLVDLTVHDLRSVYYFAQNPTQLVSASIDVNDDIFLPEIANFFRGLSSVRHLQLKREMRLFTYLNSLFDEPMPVFHNLSCFKTTLNWFNSVKEFLLSLQCAPNLENLEVTVNWLKGTPLLELRSWCAPDCFLSKLKRVKVRRLKGDDYELPLLELILKKASVLKELRIEFRVIVDIKDRDVRVRKEHVYCETFFKLPRSSPTIELVFSGEYLNATSNAVVR